MSNWQPTIHLDNLQQRAKLLAKIRAFFTARNILEVETPLLSQHTVTDVHIDSFAVPYEQRYYYLQTSPEYAMKRLLAAGSGPIFQICKSFRYGEVGSEHNPEFSMLEWYRPGFNHHDLMDEIDALLQAVLQTPPAKKQSYRELFIEHIDIDPLTENLKSLHKFIRQQTIDVDTHDLDTDTCLQWIMSEIIEPKIGLDAPLMVYDFPATQAALAKIRSDNPPVAERFEIYIQGRELANGFHELTDAAEQKARFIRDQKKRRELNKPIVEIDTRLLEALPHMPACAGVAMGIDRLIMLALQADEIKEVISFSWKRA